LKHKKLTHEMLRLMGILLSKTQTEFDRHTLQRALNMDNVTFYGNIRDLIEHLYVVKLKRENASVYYLTEQGREVANRWQAAIIALTPSLPTFEELKKDKPGP
jgi:DNA-binding PadR family transcriptional regulator